MEYIQWNAQWTTKQYLFEAISILLRPYGKPKSSILSVIAKGLANPFRKIIMVELLAVFCEYLYTKVSVSNWYGPFYI